MMLLQLFYADNRGATSSHKKRPVVVLYLRDRGRGMRQLYKDEGETQAKDEGERLKDEVVKEHL